EADRQIPNLKKGQRRIGHRRVLTSITSRSPSPSRLKQRTVSVSAAPGKMASHQKPERILAAPSATIIPHSAVGGLIPRPMKDKLAALSTAQPKPVETCTVSVGSALGIMKPNRICRLLLPPALAASTNCCERRTLTSERANL